MRITPGVHRWLSLGIHVITPNKRLGSGPLADYLAVKEAQRHYHAHFMAEVLTCLLTNLVLPSASASSEGSCCFVLSAEFR